MIPTEIFRQARVAFDEADAVIMVVDGRSELAAPDMELVRLLMRGGKPLFLAVNKVTIAQEARLRRFPRLGIRKIFLVPRTRHGLDDVVERAGGPAQEEDQFRIRETEPVRGRQSPEEAERSDDEIQGRKVAIIGHPNVGKSTLLNQLTGTARAIVSPIPGTTRDAMDEWSNATAGAIASSTPPASAARARPADGAKNYPW